MSWLRAGLSYAGGSELDGTDWRSVKVTFRGLERLHPVRLDLIAISIDSEICGAHGLRESGNDLNNGC